MEPLQHQYPFFGWNVKCQTAEKLQPWFETGSEGRRGVHQTIGNTHLEEAGSRHTSLLTFKGLDLTRARCFFGLAGHHQSSLDDSTQLARVRWSQKSFAAIDCTNAIGICFQFCLEGIIIVFHWYYGSGEKCANAHSHFIKVLYPQDLKVLQFFITATSLEKKKKKEKGSAVDFSKAQV